jgi:hypothetical protein
MVSGNVVNMGSQFHEFEYFPNNLNVRSREVLFSELPNVNDVAIENENLGLYRFKVVYNFERVAPECSEVKIA